MVDQLRAGAVGIIPGMETVDRTPKIFDHYQAGRDADAVALYGEILPTLVFLEKSINHFVTCSREILAQRLKLAGPVQHRLARELTPFSRGTITRCAQALGVMPERTSGTGGSL